MIHPNTHRYTYTHVMYTKNSLKQMYVAVCIVCIISIPAQTQISLIHFASAVSLDLDTGSVGGLCQWQAIRWRLLVVLKLLE
jgi:hypothetical protein